MNYRNSDNDSKFSVIPPVIKNIPDNIANVPAVIQDLPYAIKDMGNDLMHSAPVGYISNMLLYQLIGKVLNPLHQWDHLHLIYHQKKMQVFKILVKEVEIQMQKMLVLAL